MCASRAKRRQDENRHDKEEEDNDDDVDDPCCDIILPDLPTDDELVQNFVRRDPALRAYMSSGGNLCRVRVATKVLLRSQNNLSGLNRWGVARSWPKLLRQLAKVPLQILEKG